MLGAASEWPAPRVGSRGAGRWKPAGRGWGVRRALIGAWGRGARVFRGSQGVSELSGAVIDWARQERRPDWWARLRGP